MANHCGLGCPILKLASRLYRESVLLSDSSYEELNVASSVRHDSWSVELRIL
jgi:hypothetical protein